MNLDQCGKAMTDELGLEVRIAASLNEAIDRVTCALKTEGLGVLTRIDIDRAFREKIGADFRSYTILGACNPQLAHAALTAVPEIGLILPCNVTVEAADDGSTARIVNPAIMLETEKLRSDDMLRTVAAADATEASRAGPSTQFTGRARQRTLPQPEINRDSSDQRGAAGTPGAYPRRASICTTCPFAAPSSS